jgi:hypothetical protein
MYRLQKIIELCAILSLVVLISQCNPKCLQKETNLDSIYARYSELKSAGFHKEIVRLQEITQKYQDKANAMVHLQLAFLYSHYRNPTPNYHATLKELKTYASLDLKEGKADIIQNWLTILKEIVRLDGQHARLDKENVRLNKENNEMKEKIEQLQYLDIELEKRRKQVK